MNRLPISIPFDAKPWVRKLSRQASKVSSLPFLNFVSPAAPAILGERARYGYLACQRLAYAAVKEVAALLQDGWTEQQTAALIDTYLKDHGVRSYFHKPFVWFGERTRFDGVRNYAQYSPSRRVVRENEIVILDVAPVLGGYTADIGYTCALGLNPELEKFQQYLLTLRAEIPNLFLELGRGGAVWNALAQKISAAGFENIHQLYPFSVLGHRVHEKMPRGLPVSVLNFGWQSYWSLLSRGLFGQLLNADHEGTLQGLWAIEPHIGIPGAGAKFEEILVVEKDRVYWLEEKAPWI